METKGNILMQKYDLGRVLGQGNFAKVYHGRNLETGQSVAIKVIDKEKVAKAGLVEQTMREISGMALVKHPHVVQLYEVMATKSKIYFVMELAKGGELFNKVAKGRLKEDAARKYFQQLIDAVDFCHRRDVYHRDLKPENLLLDEHGNVKVSDFGLSALAESKRQDGLLHTTCGTPAYVAPEVISRKGYDGTKADIWSCGVILFVLLAGYLPFHDTNLIEMYKKICRAEYKYPTWFSTSSRKLLSRILDPNPRTRFSIAKIKENSWFKNGLESRYVRTISEENEKVLQDANVVSGASASMHNSISLCETKLEFANLNAFDIISLSSGFDLSALFITKDQKEELLFTSVKPALAIISKLEELGKNLKLEVKKKEGGLMRFEGSNGGKLGSFSIDAEIFQITPSFHLVELKRLCGDYVEYQKMLRRVIRPTLDDIVWAWQGEQPHQQ